MPRSEISFASSARTLQKFAALCLAVFAGLACWQGLERDHPGLALVLAGLAVAVGLLGLGKPQAIRGVSGGVQFITLPIGWAVSEVILALLFFGLFAPLGLVFRLLGRDALGRRQKERLSTCWAPKPAPDGTRSYFRQF
jgi:hypothetical protein